VIKRQPVTASDLDEVEKAAQACPEGAILIHRTD
jgi:ferredoxin